MSWIPVPAALSQRFVTLEPFAHGQGGSLYLVDEPETGRRGLLKILAPVYKDQLSERQRLRRELIKQPTLLRTHLVVPLASGETEGFSWIFREWLDGVALDVRLSREGALQQTEALAIAAQIASALDELHRGGLLHRDVKPGHIFLQPTPHGIPRALLLDAGVASPLVGDGASTIYGTAGYVAPEQLLGKLVSFRSDLYSLGCVLYRMLTGRPAFAGESLEQTLAVQRQGDLPPSPADLPNGIGALLQSILAKDPQQRPFSAQKLRRTLDPFLPDGALMEKQTTTTFETVPEPSPSIAPQPSGTLKPPPPPGARASMAPPPAPPQALVNPRSSSAPPPPPPSRQPIREENTQQIDIAQLQEIAQPKRTLPPPTPVAAKSSAPPPPRPAPITDKTQPIRLDQILAVSAAQRAANQPPKLAEPEPEELPELEEDEPELPIKPIEEEATGVFQPRHVAGAPRSTERPVRTQQPALFTAQDEPFAAPPPSSMMPGLPAPALFQPAVEAARAVPRPAASAPPPPFKAPASVLPQPAPIAAAAPIASSAAFAPTLNAASPVSPGGSPGAAAQARTHVDPSSSMAEGLAKATLMGIGSDPLEPPAPFEPSAFDAAGGPRGERDHETERVSLLSPPPRAVSLDDASMQEAFGLHASAAGSIPSGPGATGQRRDSRRLLMYASAAVVGLAVLSVGASALRGKPEPVASPVVQTPPALPAVGAAQLAAAEPAQAPRPTVHSLAPSTAPLAPAEPVAAPSVTPVLAAAEPTAAVVPEPAPAKLAPIAQVEPPKAEPKLALAENAAEPREPIVSSGSKRSEPAEQEVRASKHGAHHEARERARAAKSSSPSDKTSDKAAQFAAARDEARAAYAAKNYKAAAAAYERASRYDPTHAGTFAGLGAARLQQGDNKGAVQAYQRAVKLSPDTSGFHAALGRAYLAAGDKSKATSEYKRALAIDPSNEAAKQGMQSI